MAHASFVAEMINRENMMKPRQSLNKRQPKYWGILVPEIFLKIFRKPDKFVNLLQAQAKNIRMSVKERPERSATVPTA